jgi:hypothetical protein
LIQIMKNIKSSKQFKKLNEAENPLDKSYIDNIESRARGEHNDQMRRGEIDPRNLMRMVDQLQSIQSEGDNIAKLEDLAKDIMEEHFGAILDGIKLDYSIVKSGDEELGEMADEMQEKPDEEEEEEEEDFGSNFEMPDTTSETDKEQLGHEVNKRKLINNVIQGAAKNTHRIIHSEVAKNGLETIDSRLFPLIDKLIKTAEFMEWQIPPEAGMGMMANQPNGASSVEFDNEEEESQESPESQEDEEGQETEQEDKSSGITVKAKAIDFIILLHELVKGVFEAIATRALPADQEFAQKVLGQTDTLEDEFYDLRNGPYIKKDLDAFIAQNRKIGEVENGLEFFYGAFMDLPAEEFVQLFKDIISGTDDARQKVDAIIDETLDEVIAWYKEEGMREAGLGNDTPNEEPRPSGPIDNDIPESTKLDYSTMSKRDLQVELDTALDSGDFKTAGEIGKYI